MSPKAYTPSAVVSKRSFTLINPRGSVSTPAAARLSVSELGTRPVSGSASVRTKSWTECLRRLSFRSLQRTPPQSCLLHQNKEDRHKHQYVKCHRNHPS